MRALDVACRMSWAMTQDALQTLLQVAARENLGPEAVAAQLGRPLDNTRAVTVRDGVASIPVEGPIFRYANLFTQISGATSIEALATDLHAALADPAIRAIVLSVDSPGGEVNGTSEFAQMLFDARGRKPITAYVSDLGCSAAYWIASAADEIVVADTATVGSIGVIAAMRDPGSKGVKDIQFVSSQSPNKRPDPTTEKGRIQIQTMIDDLADVFVGAIARNRGVSAETVLTDFGQGGVFVGQKAVDAGLADRVGSYESVLSDASNQTDPRYSPLAATASEGATDMSKTEAVVAEETIVEAPKLEAESAPQIDAAEFAAMKERLAALERSEAEATARAQAEAEKRLALEQENRRRELAALTTGWHGETDQHVALMANLSPEHLAFYVETMNATRAQIEAGVLFASAGASAPATDADESPLARLQGRIAALQSAESLDYSKAAQRAVAEDPSLYQAYRSINS